MKELLYIQNFSVSTLEQADLAQTIVKHISLSIKSGQVHAIMGPNGSGKSSLAYALAGHPKYRVQAETALFCGQVLAKLPVDKRAQLGLFLAFQYPYEIPGTSAFSVLKEMYSAKTQQLVTVAKFSKLLFEYMDLLQIDHGFAHRSLNQGFSGGEKKKFEILQMLLLQPTLAILDEIDSGLDIDALRIVSQGILHAKKQNPDMGIILITHYQRILDYITPDMVHIMYDGEIKKSGTFELVQELEQSGYEKLLKSQ